MRDRVRAVGELGGTVAATASEVEGPNETGSSGGDVNGSSAGEVEDTVDVAPASGAPGPVRDGVVDDLSVEEESASRKWREDERGTAHGRPKEANDEDREEAGALSAAANGDDGGESGEHALEEGEEEGGDFGGSDGRRIEDVHETEVLEVTDEGTSAREGEGVAPEEPAEKDE